MSSILWAGAEPDGEIPGEGAGPEPHRTPDQTLIDLNLHRAVADITAGKREYSLEPLFALPLANPEEVSFRQEIFRDLEEPALYQGLSAFARRLSAVRRSRAQAERASYPKERHRWHLDAVTGYCDALRGLAETLEAAPLTSAGLKGFRDWLRSHRESEPFRNLSRSQETLQKELGAVRFSVLLDLPDIEVRAWQEEEELEGPVYELFRKFRRGTSRNYLKDYPGSGSMNHMEAQILDRVALMYPDSFTRLESFFGTCRDFIDPGIETFDREAQFYLSVLDYLAPLQQAGLPLCYPRVWLPVSEGASEEDDRHEHEPDDFARGGIHRATEIFFRDLYDPVLARELISQGEETVTNDLHLLPHEQVLIVTGPNQGGKTTFARALGQQFHLASLGCPVPGREASFPYSPRVFTHFGKEEDLQELRSALEDDLHRLEEILEQAGPGTVVLLNELFSSTTLEDALVLSQRVLAELRRGGALTVMVTFLDDLAEDTPGLVSLVAGIDPRDRGARTFRVTRAPADGQSFATAVAARYGLTYGQLRERIES